MDGTVTSPKPVIGILGGIGSGKSLVARQLASLGCGVIEADALAKAELDAPAVREELVRWWGPAVLDALGRVDRKAVGAIVFQQPEQLARLEALVHPRVHAQRAVLRQRYHADPAVRAIVEDMPLLLEKGFEDQCDVLVFVEASPATRLARVMRSRGWDQAELDRRQKSQLPLDTKARQADYVIDNNGGEAECFAQVRQMLSQILHQKQ